MSGLRAARAAEIAAATPADRDRFIDLLRVGSLIVVVAGHWLMATVTVAGGTVTPANALGALPGLQPVTWALQVMPLFFVAGGFSNLVVWRSVRGRGGGYAEYLYGRLVRLLRPTLVFAVTTQVALAGAGVAGLGPREVDLVGRVLGQPLWFLTVYLGAVAAAPALIRWHVRSPVAAVATLGAGAVLVDVLRFAGVPGVAWANLVFVWLFAQQVGFCYADGLLTVPRRLLWLAVAGSMAVLAVLTGPGPYPVSMVGLPGEESNMNPPTVCLLVLTVGQAAAVMLARRRLAGLLARPAPWSAVVAVGSTAMTVYLWHVAVLVIGFGVLVGLGAPPPDPGTGWWWATRPAWLAVLGAVLLGVARVVRRAEGHAGRRRTPAPPGRGRTAAALAGVVVAALGLLGYVTAGLAPAFSGTTAAAVVPAGPVSSTVLVMAGLLVVAAAAGRWRPRPDTCILMSR